MSEDNFTRFSFKRMDGTSAVYGGAHELHNEVLITFPEGYFDKPWPAWVDVPDFWVMPGEQPISDFAPDRSGIAADDDPTRQPLVKCPGCDEEVAALFDGEVVRPGKVGLAAPKKFRMCVNCWEVAENADVHTGAYGAAAAEWVGMRYNRGIPK